MAVSQASRPVEAAGVEQAASPPEAEAGVVAPHAEPQAAEAQQDAAAGPEEAAAVLAAWRPGEAEAAEPVAWLRAGAVVLAASPQALPAAGLSAAASASRRDRVLPWPVRRRSARFARARWSLQVASL